MKDCDTVLYNVRGVTGNGGALVMWGNMRELAEGFYKSAAWQNCRSAYAASKHWLCEVCLAKGRYVPGEIVHHKIHITPENITKPEITLSWDNLQLLCRDCHADMHKPAKRYTVDELGRVSARE